MTLTYVPSVALAAMLLGLGAVSAAHQNTPALPDRRDETHTSDKFDRMFPDGRDHNFGKVKSGTPVHHTLRIVNTSKRSLEITDLRNYMQPLSAYVTKGVLQPNEAARIEIIVDTRRFHGPKTMTLWLATKQGNATQAFRLSITGNSEE